MPSARDRHADDARSLDRVERGDRARFGQVLGAEEGAVEIGGEDGHRPLDRPEGGQRSHHVDRGALGHRDRQRDPPQRRGQRVHAA